MKGINYYFIRELKAFLTQKHYLFILIIIPPIIFVLYGFIYQNRAIHNLPVVIWDEDQSELSRELTFFLQSSEDINIVDFVHNKNTVDLGMQKGDYLACIHFPKKMEVDIKRHHVPKIGLYINSTNLVIGKLLYRYNMEILMTAVAGVSLEKFVIEGVPREKTMALVQSFRLDVRNGYNATFNYQQYLVPGLCTVGLQMIIIMAACLGLNREKKLKVEEDKHVMFIGKFLAFLAISTFWSLILIYVYSPIFGIEHQGNFWDYTILFTLFNMACISVGFLLSAYLKDKMLASDFALFYTSPAFVFSGFTFPIWAMPFYDQYYAQILPYTPFLSGFFKTYFMEESVFYLKSELIHLAIFIGIALPLAYWKFQKKEIQSA